MAKYLKPGVAYNRLPEPHQIRAVARVLGCPVARAVAAFNASLDDPLPLTDLPDDEMELLGLFRAMDGDVQRHMLAIGRTLAVHSDDITNDARPAPPARRARPRAVS